MDKRGAILAVIILVFSMLFFIQLIEFVKAAPCSSCSECTGNLTSAGGIATLTADLTTGFGSGAICISMNASNTLLDCAGKDITNGASTLVGVNVTGPFVFTGGQFVYQSVNNITIRNCGVIADFTRSIDVHRLVTNITVRNNTLGATGGFSPIDIGFRDGPNNTRILNNTFKATTAIIFDVAPFNNVTIDNNSFVATEVAGVSTGINFAQGDTNIVDVNISHNKFIMSSNQTNPIVFDAVGARVLVFKNNFLNGTITLGSANSPSFNLSNIGNHWWNYNETNDVGSGDNLGNCTTDQLRRDGEGALICDNPFNISANFANDSFARIDWFQGPNEYTFPNIRIVYPTNLTNTSATNVTLNISATDNQALSNCWYQLNNSGANISFTCLENSSFLRSEGRQNITVYVNDTSNNVNLTDILIFTTDFTPPNVTVDDPVNNSFHQIINRSLNFSGVTDALTSIDRCFYNLNSATSNVTVDCFANTSFNADRSNNTLIFYSNDTAGNVNATEVTFHVADILSPNLTILSIANNSNLSSTNVTLDIHVADNLGLDRCWYQLNNTGVNISFTCLANTSFLQSNSNSSNITVYANDTAGNLNVTDIAIFRIDTLFPTLVVNEPVNNSQYNTSNRISLNITISDVGTGINNCYFSMAHTPNSTFDCLNQNTTFLSDEGVINVTVFSNDSAGNVNFSDVVVYNMTDIVAPRLTILHPTNLTNTTATANISLNFTVTDSQSTDECWYSLNSTGINISIDCSQNNSFSLLTNALHNITLYSNDTVGNINQTPITLFSVDNVAPSLSVLVPSNNTILPLKDRISIVTSGNFVQHNFSLNISPSDATLTLDKCWYSLNFTGINTTFECGLNTTFTASNTNFGRNETINITVYVNDTLGNVNTSDLTVLQIDITPPNVSVSAPLNKSIGTNTNISFNFTVDDGVAGSRDDECWYNLNNSNTNTTVTSLGCSDIGTSFIAGISNDNVIIAFANDTAGNEANSSPIVFTIDNVAPSLIIDTPINGSEVTGSRNESTGFRIINLNFTALDLGGSGMNQCDYQIYVLTNLGDESYLQNPGGTITSCGNLTNTTTVSLDSNAFYKIHFNNVTDNAGNNNVTSFNTTFKVIISSSGAITSTTTTISEGGGFKQVAGGGGGGSSESPLERVQKFFTDAPFTQGPAEGPDFIARSSFVGMQGPAMGYMGPGMFFSVAQAMAAYMTPQQQEMMKASLAKGEEVTVPTQDLVVTLPEKVSIPVAVPSNPISASAVTGSHDGGGVKVEVDEYAALKLNYVNDEGFNVPKVDLSLEMIEYGFVEKPVTREQIEKTELGITGITGAAVMDTVTSGSTNLILFITLIFCICALVVLILIKKN